MAAKKAIPFPFVLDELEPAQPWTRPMFGCTAVYLDQKIVFILRNKEDDPYDSGIWVCTTPDHHASLRAEFPSLRSIRLFGSAVTGWQNLSIEADDFEEAALRLCTRARAGDPRIGKIPERKKPKKAQPKKTVRVKSREKKKVAKKKPRR